MFQGGSDRLEVRGLGRVLVGTPNSMQKSVGRSLLNVPSPEPTDLFYLSSPHNPRQIKKITCVEGPCAARACCAESGAAFGCLWRIVFARLGPVAVSGVPCQARRTKNFFLGPATGTFKGGRYIIFSVIEVRVYVFWPTGGLLNGSRGQQRRGNGTDAQHGATNGSGRTTRPALGRSVGRPFNTKNARARD